MRKRIYDKIRAIFNTKMLHHAACGTGHVIEIALRDADEVILKCVPSFSN